MESIMIECVDCGKPFEFTKGEQEFYKQRNFTPPKRCKEDREKKKAHRRDEKNRYQSEQHDSENY